MTYPVSSTQDKNGLEKDSVQPDESNSLKRIRKSFVDHVKHIEKQFEKYLTEVDHNYLSLDDFWLEYFRVEHKNGCHTASPRNDIAQIITEIKLEEPIHIIDSYDSVDEVNESDLNDLENNFVSYDCNVELDVERYVFVSENLNRQKKTI